MLIENFNKHIHQIWFQKPDSNYGIGCIGNKDYIEFSNGHKDFCDKKGWGYTLWNETTVLTLIKEHFPERLEEYKTITGVIKKVDCARLMILYVYGGLYLDMDTVIKRDLDEFLNLTTIVRDDYPFSDWHIAPELKIHNSYDIIVGQEKTVYEYHYNKYGLVIPKLNNAVIFAKKEYGLFLEILDLGFKRKDNTILNSFGVHTFSLKLYQEMNKQISGMLDADDYAATSNILTTPTVYFYEVDTDADWYEKGGGNPIHKNSPNQYILHFFDGDWDENTYGDFLLNEVPGETLDAAGGDWYED